MVETIIVENTSLDEKVKNLEVELLVKLELK